MLKRIIEYIKNKCYGNEIMYKFLSYLRYLFYMQRQKRIYKKICENKRKLKIAFLVNENEKWCCQSLYDKLKQSNRFEPVIFLTSLNDFKRPDIEEKFNRNIEFFTKYCNNVQIVCNIKTKQFDNLEKYKPDIVVYQQPWGIAKNQNLFSISKFALAVYIPYCFVEEYDIIKKFKYNFHYLLFREYISHDLIEKEYKNNGYKKNNLKVVGYTKLESYLDNKKHNKKYIVYAPHYSIKEESLRLGTFDWNGNYILEYAKKHSEFNWIFKPHPRCKYSFLETKMFQNMKEIDDYYNEWAKIGKVFDKGNYVDLFKQTKCLITDCASFLIEFLPTEFPVINLKRKDSVYISTITEEITKSYYKVYNIEELKKVLCDVLENNIDSKKQERLELIKNLNIVRNASDIIVEDLEKSFYK